MRPAPLLGDGAERSRWVWAGREGHIADAERGRRTLASMVLEICIQGTRHRSPVEMYCMTFLFVSTHVATGLTLIRTRAPTVRGTRMF